MHFYLKNVPCSHHTSKENSMVHNSLKLISCILAYGTHGFERNHGWPWMYHRLTITLINFLSTKSNELPEIPASL